jgi:hypothetical protein
MKSSKQHDTTSNEKTTTHQPKHTNQSTNAIKFNTNTRLARTRPRNRGRRRVRRRNGYTYTQ